MRKALEQSLNRIWYGDRRPGVILSSLERVYRALFFLNQLFNRFRRARDLQGKPIIVIGNLNAGGAGKTPLVIRLCELARSCGLNAGVISKGYGRRSKQALRISTDMDPRDTGDEPFLISRRCKVPVQVDSDRERAARELFEDELDLVISDDGLQRNQLPRWLEICVVDQQRGFGNGRQLPAGPLRESVSRLESVDFVIKHMSAGSNVMFAEGHCMRLKPGRLVKLHGGETLTFADANSHESEIHAIAGIARPDRFFEMLQHEGVQANCHPFKDHHRYRKSDFDSIPDGSMILMTEKDAVKCQKLPLLNAWYIPVEAVLSEALETALINKLDALKKSSRAKSI